MGAPADPLMVMAGVVLCSFSFFLVHGLAELLYLGAKQYGTTISCCPQTRDQVPVRVYETDRRRRSRPYRLRGAKGSRISRGQTFLSTKVAFCWPWKLFALTEKDRRRSHGTGLTAAQD